jgi:hypothetical protein
MKHIAIALVLIMIMCLLSACVSAVEEAQESETSMFVRVEHAGCWEVVYHRETKVMYAVSRGGYNAGNFTVLVNADGSPMIWGAEDGK